MARQCYTCNSNAFIRSAWKSVAFAKSGRRSGFVFENERRNTPKTLLALGFWLLAPSSDAGAHPYRPHRPLAPSGKHLILLPGDFLQLV
jgi:hypothetical protein